MLVKEAPGVRLEDHMTGYTSAGNTFLLQYLILSGMEIAKLFRLFLFLYLLDLLTHWDRDKMADILPTIYSNAFSWMKIFEFWLKKRKRKSLKYIRLGPVNEMSPVRSRYVNQWLVFVRRAGLLWSQQDFEWRWSVPLFKCLTVLEFSFILFDLCLLITFFNFIMNYVPIVTFWIFTYHKIWILSIMLCFIWSYWIIYFLACLEVSWRVVS